MSKVWKGRMLAAALLATGMVAGSAAPAKALLPGVPSIVFDPTASKAAGMRYAQMVVQAKQQVREIELAIEQTKHFRDQAKGISGFRISNLDSFLSRSKDTFGRGVALGYANGDMLKVFNQHYPRMKELENGKRIEGASEINAVRDLMYANVTASRDQGLQLEAARSEMSRLRQQVVSAKTERQVAQAQAAVQAFQAEQDMMANQVATQTAHQMAVMNAREVAREAAEFEAMRRHQQDWEEWDKKQSSWQDQLERTREELRRRLEENAAGKPAGSSGGGGVIGTTPPSGKRPHERETMLREESMW